MKSGKTPKSGSFTASGGTSSSGGARTALFFDGHARSTYMPWTAKGETVREARSWDVEPHPDLGPILPLRVAQSVTLQPAPRRQRHNLTMDELAQLIKVMRYPEREIALFATLTGMAIAEICGLQWKYVNTSGLRHVVDGDHIPPNTIAIRKQSYRCQLRQVKDHRRRDVPVSDTLAALLLEIRRGRRYAGGQDFVLCSRNGSPIHQDNVAARRLKDIGHRHGMPWLSWRVFHDAHTGLRLQLREQAGEELAKLVPAERRHGVKAD